MLTGSQKRSTGQVSSPAPSLTCDDVDWRELPPELLMMILNQFRRDDEMSQEEPAPKETITKLLSLRLVHKTWKVLIEDILENTCLDFWTKWAPTREIFKQNPYNFPSIYLHSKGSKRCNNTPTKSLHITTNNNIRNQNHDDKQVTQVLKNAGFSSKLAQQLTSLSFYIMFQPTNVKMFALIVSQTPNLKALEFETVRIKIMKRDLDNYSLSPLPHLTHLHVSNVLESLETHIHLQNFKLLNWIVSPYFQQLESFVTDECFNWKGRNMCFPKLKWLKIEHPHISLMKTPIHSILPSLQGLSIKGWSVYESKGGSMIPKFLLNFSSTLVDLHLDFEEYEDWIQLVEQIEKSADPNFSKMKSLRIIHPFEEEANVLKKMLKWFPNLETLKLTHEEFLEYLESIPMVIEQMNELKEKYCSLCPMLKRFLIYPSDEDATPFYSSVAPFFTGEILRG